MAQWLKYFPRQQIHIVDGDKLISDPFPEMTKVETFLGVRHKIGQNKLAYDRRKGFFCVDKGSRNKCLNKSKGRNHPRVKAAVKAKLRAFFKPLNEKFFELVGQRFDW